MEPHILIPVQEPLCMTVSRKDRRRWKGVTVEMKLGCHLFIGGI